MGKFAPHVINTPGWLPSIWRSFGWIKYVHPPAHDPHPDLRTIARVYIPDGETNAMIMRREAGAEEWWRAVGATMRARPWVHAWELPNEPVVGTREQCQALAAFTVRAVQLMRDAGLRCVTGQFARGTPELAAANPAECYLRELAPVFALGDYLGLHQYGPYPMWQDAPWHALRHRQLLAELRTSGIRCPPILVTEGGIDHPGGWRWYTTESEYWAQLHWCDQEYSRDPEVLAWFPFTIGATPDWSAFEISEWLARHMAAEMAANPPEEEHPVLGTRDNPIPTSSLQIVTRNGRPVRMTAEEFIEYAQGLTICDPYDIVFLHHTAIPTRESWRGAETILAMKRYYEQEKVWQDVDGRWYRGWTRGPHLFVAEDGIWLFSPLAEDGVGVAGHNTASRHLEMVGNYNAARPDGATLTNTVAVLGALLSKAGLSVDALHFHREYATTDCPGKAVTREWVRGLVQAWLDGYRNESQADLERLIGERIQAGIIPLNPNAAFERAGMALGLLPASGEMDVTFGDKTYRAQAYRSPGQREWQHIVYTEVGKWSTSDLRWFKRAN